MKAESQGWRFPTFSRDEVIQFSVEEAVIDRLRHVRENAAKYADAVEDAQEKVRAELARAAGDVRE